MTHEQTEKLRINLLRQLASADPMSLNIDALRTGARLEGFDLGADQHTQNRAVQIECEHLADPSVNLIRLADAKFSSVVKRYRITAPGREWLAEQGF